MRILSKSKKGGLDGVIMFVRVKDGGWHHINMEDDAENLAVVAVQTASTGNKLLLSKMPKEIDKKFDDMYAELQEDEKRGLSQDINLRHPINTSKN